MLFLLYETPHPTPLPDGGPETRGYGRAEVKESSVDADGLDRLVVQETVTKGEQFADLPTVITAGPGPRPGAVQTALLEVASDVADRIESGRAGVIAGPARDLLLRQAPTLTSSALPDVDDDDFITAITAAVELLDDSAVAVQGPPGTGKTYVGAHVIAALVDDGWRIGVVSQGHAAVDHLLDDVVKAGVDPTQVAKKQRPSGSHGGTDDPNTATTDSSPT